MNILKILIDLVKRFLGGSLDLPKLFDLLQDHHRKNGGKLDLPSGLLPKEIELAIESVLNGEGDLSNLPLDALDGNTIKKLMGFLEQNR